MSFFQEKLPGDQDRSWIRAIINKETSLGTNRNVMSSRWKKIRKEASAGSTFGYWAPVWSGIVSFWRSMDGLFLRVVNMKEKLSRDPEVISLTRARFLTFLDCARNPQPCVTLRPKCWPVVDCKSPAITDFFYQYGRESAESFQRNNPWRRKLSYEDV